MAQLRIWHCHCCCIVYHRINKHFLHTDKESGIHREVCIDRMYFNEDGTIRRVIPTQEGVAPVKKVKRAK